MCAETWKLNELLEAEAEKLTQTARYERSGARQGYRNGHYDRNLTATAGNVTLHVLQLKGEFIVKYFILVDIRFSVER